MAASDTVARSADPAEPRPEAVQGAASPSATVVLGQIDESFHQVGEGVAHEMLRRLGHAVEVREGAHPEIYPLLGNGEVHLFATSWLPGGHGAY